MFHVVCIKCDMHVTVKTLNVTFMSCATAVHHVTLTTGVSGVCGIVVITCIGMLAH